MGGRFSYFVSFRVTHPTLDPAAITRHVAAEAKVSWAAGEPRKTAKGRPLGGMREESYCAFDMGSGDDGALAECLDVAVARVKPARELLRQMRASGGSLTFFVSWFSTGDTGEVFGADLLAEMADLGIELGINVYGPPQA